jgi:hypothetical protein
MTGQVPTVGPRSMGAQQVLHNAEYAELFKRASQKLGSVAGTNTITATADPTIASYADGQCFTLVPASTNTGAVTLNIDAVGAIAVLTAGGSALAAGLLVAGRPYHLVYEGGSFYALNVAEVTTDTDDWQFIESRNFAAAGSQAFTGLSAYNQLRWTIDATFSSDTFCEFQVGSAALGGFYTTAGNYIAWSRSVIATGGTGTNQQRSANSNAQGIRLMHDDFDASGDVPTLIRGMINRFNDASWQKLVIGDAAYLDNIADYRMDHCAGIAALLVAMDRIRFFPYAGGTWSGNILLEGRSY